jgi:hypothetical protein
MTKGSCECGAVAFEITEPVRKAAACHCSQCRKTSGHIWAGTLVKDEALNITKADGLKWFRSSDFASRGFCKSCGSSLFYRRNDSGSISVACGSLDGATELALIRHIFVADKGSYYEIGDGLDQFAQF